MTLTSADTHISISPAPEQMIDIVVSDDFKEAFLSVLNTPSPDSPQRKKTRIKRNSFYEPFLRVVRWEAITKEEFIYLESFALDRDFIREIFETLEEKKANLDVAEWQALNEISTSLNTIFQTNLFALKVKLALDGGLTWVEPEYIADLAPYKLVKVKDSQGFDELCVIREDGVMYGPVHIWKPGKMEGNREEVFLDDLTKGKSAVWKAYWSTPLWVEYFSFQDGVWSAIAWDFVNRFETDTDAFIVYKDKNHVWFYSLHTQNIIFSMQYEWEAPDIRNIVSVWGSLYVVYECLTVKWIKEVIYSITDQKELTAIMVKEGSVEKIFHLFWRPVVLYRQKISSYNRRILPDGVLSLVDALSHTYIFPPGLNPPDTEPLYELQAYEFGSYNTDTQMWKSPDDIDRLLRTIIRFQPASFIKDGSKPLDKHPDLQNSLTVPFFTYDASGAAHHLMISQKTDDVVQIVLDNTDLIKGAFLTACKKFATRRGIQSIPEEYLESIEWFNALWGISNQQRIILYKLFCNDDFFMTFILSLIEICTDSSDIKTRSIVEILEFYKSAFRKDFLRRLIVQTNESAMRGVLSKHEFFDRYELLASCHPYTFYIGRERDGYVCAEGDKLYNNIIFAPSPESRNKDSSSLSKDEEGIFTIQKNDTFDIISKEKDSASPTGWKLTKVASINGKAFFIHYSEGMFIEYTESGTTYLYSVDMKKPFFSIDDNEGVIELIRKIPIGYYVQITTPPQLSASETKYTPSTWFALLWEGGQYLGKYSLCDCFETVQNNNLLVGRSIAEDEKHVIIDTDGNILYERVERYEVVRNEASELVLTGVYDISKFWSKKPKWKRFYIPLHQR